MFHIARIKRDKKKWREKNINETKKKSKWNMVHEANVI